jgi:hypothetical protein
MNSWSHCTVLLPCVTPRGTGAAEEPQAAQFTRDSASMVFDPTDEVSNTDLSSRTFTVFSNFPREIRLKIWRATFEPRKIVIRVESDGWISPSSVSSRPVALYVCSESREETLKCYRLLFAKSRHPTYINPLIDIPHFRHGSKGNRRVKLDSSYWLNFSQVFLTNLRHSFDFDFFSILRQLAIDRDLWVLRMGSAAKVMSLFGKLEKLYIVIDDEFLRDEDEWVDADEFEQDQRDIILFMTGLSDDAKPPDSYHRAEERFYYILRRTKLRTTSRDISYFTEPQQSLGYAAYVKEDVLANLNEGVGLGSIRKRPQVDVVVEEPY